MFAEKLFLVVRGLSGHGIVGELRAVNKSFV
jgi:hypothetical protein